jgi:hypothetical protein
MDQYKISQTPGSKTAKKTKKNKVQAPKQRDTQSISPQLITVIVVLVLALVLAGVVVAHFMTKKATSNSGASSAASKAASKSGASVAVSGKTFTGVTNAFGSKNVGALNSYYASKVHVVLIRSGVNQTYGSGQVGAVVSNPITNALTPWDWHVPAGQLAAWQTGPYGQYFLGNVVVGISSDGTVAAIHFDSSGQIDGIFMAPVGDLTTPTPSANGGTTTPSGGGTTKPTPTPTTTPLGGVENSD